MSRLRLYLSFVVVFLAISISKSASSQTFTILHSFSGGGHGANPSSGLTADIAGNLYGTTYGGGIGVGTVFKLKHVGSGWVLSTLYTFQGGSDGANPQARVVFGPNNNLYGTTTSGGQGSNGTIFSLRPPVTVCVAVHCPWSHTILHRFIGGADGANPQYADLVFDTQGTMYGTTMNGGTGGAGTVYELMQSGGSWTESVIYPFQFNGQDGVRPFSGVIFDSMGNLYGTASSGGTDGNGAVYELIKSGSIWTYNQLYAFTGQSDGSTPEGGLIFDNAGNLFGTTALGGASGGGTAFELSPPGNGWTVKVLYSFNGLPGPLTGLTMDAAGNLYGTNFGGGLYGRGSVFKLTYSGGMWNYTSLHDFTGGTDGGNPLGTLILDASGNIYGTASSAGPGGHGNGAVWEITP